jgi:thiamine-monophosphate kinase
MVQAASEHGSELLLTDIGEYALHRWLAETLTATDQNLIRGAGDDCAVLDIGLPDSYLVATSDRVPLLTDRKETGRFAVVHNVSDVLAMRGTPIGFLLNVYLPRDTPLHTFQDIVIGARDACLEFRTVVIGGDTKEDSKSTVVGTCIGLVRREDLTLRSTARAGDVVALTRTSGKRLGLRWAYWIANYFDVCRERHHELHAAYLDQLRIPYDIMIRLQGVRGVTSCIDMTEGLLGASAIVAGASDVSIVFEESLLSALIGDEVRAVAAELEKPPITMLFNPGFDWENLLTLEAAAAGEILARFPGEILPIGRVETGNGVHLETHGIRRQLRIFSDQKFQRHAWEHSAKAWADQQWYESRK